jgi:hypothetical protein
MPLLRPRLRWKTNAIRGVNIRIKIGLILHRTQPDVRLQQTQDRAIMLHRRRGFVSIAARFECSFGSRAVAQSRAVVQGLHLFPSCRSAMCKNKRFKLQETTMNFPGLITNYVFVLIIMCIVSLPPAEF